MPVANQELDLQSMAHRRYNALSGDWILVSPHRTVRPWGGQLEAVPPPAVLQFDPGCYLCPGNVRASGAANPRYAATFVFDNDYPALYPTGATDEHHSGGGLLRAHGEPGGCRVICYSPRHDLGLGQMPPPAIRAVIDTWAAETQSLGANPQVNAVTIFENRGAMMGASNPHPHGQIWTNRSMPNEMRRETERQREYWQERSSCLLCDYAALESGLGERVVCGNEQFVAVVPFWATWPFETLVLPRAHHGALASLDEAPRDALAKLLSRLIRAYDALFETPFPYTMGLHQQPTDRVDHPEWHLHAHFYPPLLRSATVRKFMVGYELLGGPQRDLTPEVAAARLRAVLPVA